MAKENYDYWHPLVVNQGATSWSNTPMKQEVGNRQQRRAAKSKKRNKKPMTGSLKPIWQPQG